MMPMNVNTAKAMACLTHGTYIIGVHTQEKDNLMTAAWIAQAAGRPPMISVAVGKKHYTVELIQKARNFSVSVLTKRQKEIAKICGSQSGRTSDKLAQVPVKYTEDQLPVVMGSAAYLECVLRAEYDAGDHILLVGEVVGGKQFSENRDELMGYHKEDFF